MIIGLVVLVFVGLCAVLYFTGASLGGAPSLGPTNYSTSVNCEVNTVGAQGTVTISGTITGDASSYLVTVDVLDQASQQRIGGADLRGSGYEHLRGNDRGRRGYRAGRY
ncbi:hypothetical protein [Kribbella sp. DT2]|uniref:hypothetical protein n=1 Tax=Kribbella sp. DT2 TaxID=3393427 RepID=UPI003CF85559